MSERTTVADLIEKLKSKDQTLPIQFIVVGYNGAVVAIDFSTQAMQVARVLKLIGDDQ